MSPIPIRRAGNPTPLSEQAASWALRQEGGALAPRDQQLFEDWLAEDPEHVAAYEAAVWALDAASRHAGSQELMAMREKALTVQTRGLRSTWWWGGLGGALAASLVAAWLLTAQPGVGPADPVQVAESAVDPNDAVYRTAVGERLAVTLPDGSVATLDTNSRLRVAYTQGERGIHLLQGQALFEVAHARNGPFNVYAAGQRVTAVGTVFNVRLDGERVRVALVEGVVRVRPATPAQAADRPSAPATEVVMRAGEVLDAAPARPAVVRAAEVSQIASWRGGELVFDDVRLADAVAEINRYTNRPIEIADVAVGNHRVTGVFRSNDPERFSRAMSEVLPIEVARAADGSAILRERR